MPAPRSATPTATPSSCGNGSRQGIERVLDGEAEGGVALDDETAREEQRVGVLAAQRERQIVAQARADHHVRRAERRREAQAGQRELGSGAELADLEAKHLAAQRLE